MYTSLCSELVAHFGPIPEVLPTFSSQPLNDWMLDRARMCISGASQYKKHAAIIPSSKLSWKYFPSYRIIIFLIMVIERHINK